MRAEFFLVSITEGEQYEVEKFLMNSIDLILFSGINKGTFAKNENEFC